MCKSSRKKEVWRHPATGATVKPRPSQIAAESAIRNASGIGRFERQALVSNPIELLHLLRGQVFVIPVAGQVWNSETDEVIADQRAVAVVWRDPFPDDQGNRLSIVRVFQWLFH